jgi:transmembrane sensor
MSNTISDSVLDRYLAGEASSVQTEQVEAWLFADEGRVRAVELLRGDLTGAWDTNEGWHRLNERIVEHSMGIEHERLSQAKWWTQSPTLIGVAVLLLAIAGGAVAVNRSHSADTIPMAEWTTSAAIPRDRNRVELGDGSTVFLGPSTTLRYSSTTRDAELDGAALFSTSYDDAHPFVVHARSVTTKAARTEFAVRAYSGGEAVSVGVINGKLEVTVGGLRDAVVLSAGEMVSVSPKTGVRVERGIDAKVFDGWARLPPSAGEH